MIISGGFTSAISFTNRKLAKGVSVKIWKAKPPLKFSHAFYATMPSGHSGIYTRKELSAGVFAGRLPIREMRGPSVTTVYEKTPGLSDKIEEDSAERLLNEMENQVNFILSKR